MDSQPSPGISQEEIAHWISSNWKPVISGVVAVGVLGLFYVYSTTSSEAREEKATADLYELQLTEVDGPNASALNELADRSAATGIAQHARLRAAADLFAAGNFAEAERSYSTFLSEFGESPLLPEAFLGVAVSLEAQGNLDDALTKYQDIVSRFPQSSVVNRAKANQARLLAKSGQTEQAFRIYQELVGQVNSNPYAQRSSWSVEAQIALRNLLEEHPELIQTNTPPAEASTAPSLDLSLPPQQ